MAVTALTAAERRVAAAIAAIVHGSNGVTRDEVYNYLTELGDTVSSADLASEATGLGASLIGVDDATALFTATTVEGVLVEMETELNTATAGVATNVTNIASTLLVAQKAAYHARYVMTTDVADLGVFTVAQDGVTGVEGDRVLLANQTTSAQCGIYTLGAVGGGTCALTRATDMPAATVLQSGCEVRIDAGTIFGNTVWFVPTAGAITIGTTAHTWYPRSVTISQALVAGTATISSIPVLSATKTGFVLTRRIANTSTLTTGGYCVSTGGANGVTAGVVGTAAIIIEACVAAGTINNADISTLNITVIN